MFPSYYSIRYDITVSSSSGQTPPFKVHVISPVVALTHAIIAKLGIGLIWYKNGIACVCIDVTTYHEHASNVGHCISGVLS